MPRLPWRPLADDVCPSLLPVETVMGEVFRIGEPTVCGESSVASLEAPKALSAPSPAGALVLAVELVTPLIMSIAP